MLAISPWATGVLHGHPTAGRTALANGTVPHVAFVPGCWQLAAGVKPLGLCRKSISNSEPPTTVTILPEFAVFSEGCGKKGSASSAWLHFNTSVRPSRTSRSKLV